MGFILSVCHLQCWFGLSITNGMKRISLQKYLALHVWSLNEFSYVNSHAAGIWTAESHMKCSLY